MLSDIFGVGRDISGVLPLLSVSRTRIIPESLSDIVTRAPAIGYAPEAADTCTIRFPKPVLFGFAAPPELSGM